MKMLTISEINNNVKNVEKYPTDKNHYYYFSAKYWERIQNTDHCYEKNVLKCIIFYH